jgi:hypothetical protein
MRARQTTTRTLPLLVLGLGLVAAARPANAASETVIYSFQGTAQDGHTPDSDLTKVGAYLNEQSWPRVQDQARRIRHGDP